MRQDPEASNTSNQRPSRHRGRSDTEHRPAQCEAALASIQDGLLALDKNWRCTYANEAAATLLKTAPGQLIGKVIWETLPVSRYPRLHEEFTRAAEQNVVVRFEEPYAPLGSRYEYRCYPAADGLTVLFNDTDSHKQVEGAVPESCQILEKQWERTFDAVPDLIAIIDVQHRMVRVNRAMAQRLGMTAEQCAGAMCYRCVHGTDEPPAFCPHTQLLADGREHTAEIYEERLGGHFLISCTPLFDEDGRMVGSVHVARDITERKQAEEAVQEANEKLRMQTEKLQVQTEELRAQTEELRVQTDELTAANAALRQSEERYHRLFEDDLTGNFTSTPEGQILLCNPAFARMFGFSSVQDAARANMLDLYPDAAERKPLLERLKQEGKIERLEVWRKRRDGEPIYVVENLVGHFNERGELYEIKGYIFDDTERRQAEEALRTSEEKFRTLHTMSPIAIVLNRLDNGQFLESNQALWDMTGYTDEEFRSLTYWDITPIEYEKMEAKQLELLHTVGRYGPYEKEYIRKDGSRFPVLLSGVRIKDPSGTDLIYSVIQDVTELKAREQALRESEERHRRLVENLKGSHFIYVHDTKGVFNYLSESLTDILGYTMDEFMAHYSTYLTDHPVNQDVQRYTEGSLRGIRQPPYEVNIWHKDGSSRWLEVQEAPVFDAEGKVIAVEGVAQDITERKQAEEALHSIALFPEENPWPVLRVARDGTLLYANPPSARLLELWNCRLGQPIPDEIRGQVERALDDGEVIDTEVVCGEVVYSFSLAPIASEDYVNLYGRNVTEHKRAEEALRESEERHRFLVESVNDWIWEVDRNGVYTYVSPQCREVLGYEPQEIVGKTPYDLMPPEEARRVREVFDATAGQVKPIHRLENVNRRKDGRLVVLETNGAPVLDAQGKLAGYRGIDRDITERKRAEEALRESRERLERAQEIAHLGSWELDLVNDRLTWSDEVYRIFGLAPQEFGATYEAFLDHVHPEDRATVDAAYTGSLRENRDTYGIEHRIVRKDTGEIRLVHEKCEHFRDDTGRIVRSVGMVHDITERKQAEEALRRSEERYHRLFEDDLTGNFICTPEGRILLCNPAFAKVFGFSSAQEAVGTSMLDLYLDRKERQALLDELKNRGKIERFEVWRKRRDGQPIYIVENLVGHFNERGELYEIKGYVFDDTERKWAEEALRQAKTFTDKLLNAPLDTVFLFEPVTGKPVRWNKRFAEVSGYNDEEIARMKAPDDFYDEDDLKKAKECTDRILANGQGVTTLSLITKQGVHIPFEYAVNVVEAEGGKALFLSIGRDMTERKRAEEALRESEARLRVALDAGRMGTWVWDLATDTVDTDPLHRRLWDLDNADGRVLSSAILQRIHPEDRALAFDRESVEHRLTGPSDMEFRVVRRDGSITWLQGAAVAIRDASGVLRKVVGVNFDITERKRAEEALRELTRTLESKVARRTAELEHRAQQLQKLALELSLAEDRERKHLAEVLHDDLQQQLAAAKFHLQMLSNRVRHEPSQQEITTKVDQMLKDAIEKSRNLSHELSPAVLYHGNLAETISWLADQVQAKHGLIVHVDAFNEVTVQSDALKAFLYKAAQELLFNVVKHARVSEARVRLRRVGRCVCLSVSDHGRGFDPQKLRETAGFGLFSIRERIELLGGRMTIKSAAGQGSTFHIVVPDRQETEYRGRRAEGRAARHAPSSLLGLPSSAPVLRVLLADDHEIVREGLASLLAEVPGIEVVGEAANGREAINQANRLRPDVVIMDVAMPLINGDEATRQIKMHLPATRVVALSMYEEPDLVEKMRQAGAEGYILKTAPAEELVAAIRGR